MLIFVLVFWVLIADAEAPVEQQGVEVGARLKGRAR